VSSVTKVKLVKWPYLCAARHRQRLVLSCTCTVSRTFSTDCSKNVQYKITRISVRWEPNSRGRT